MIDVGDIVFRKYSGGKISRVDYASIGLVLETHQPKGCLAQYKVAFHGSEPAWWEGRHLHKIQEDSTQ